MTNKRPSIAFAVTVHDVTGHESDYNLDKNGFQFIHHVSEEKTFDDEGRITSLYYREVEQLLKDVWVSLARAYPRRSPVQHSFTRVLILIKHRCLRSCYLQPPSSPGALGLAQRRHGQPPECGTAVQSTRRPIV